MKVTRESKFYNEYPCCRIREQIGRLGMSMVEAAEAMKKAGIQNVTSEAVRQWCGGYSRPDMNKLKDIAKVLDCSINYLFGIDDLPDMTEAGVRKLTGLSGAAVRRLTGGKEEHLIAAINILAENWQ